MALPEVIIEESDYSSYIPYFTNEIAAFVGDFEKGPVNHPVFINDINQFKFIFGRGIGTHFNDWYQVYNYMQYATGIWVIRSSTGGCRNASNETNSLYEIHLPNDFKEVYDDLYVDDMNFIAQTTGAWGNLLSVAVLQHEDWDNNEYVFADLYAKNIFRAFKEDHVAVCVFRKEKLVEKFYFPKTDITNIDNQVNSLSSYIYLKGLTVNSYVGENIISLKNGITTAATPESLAISYELLSEDSYDIDIIIGNQLDNNLAIELAELRKDCMAFIALPDRFVTYLMLMLQDGSKDLAYTTGKGLVIATHEHKVPAKLSDKWLEVLLDYANSIRQSEFAHFTLHLKEQYDGFTGRTRIVNIAGDIAGLKAQASLTKPFNAAAGLERGAIKNATRIINAVRPTDVETYYEKGFNFIQNFHLMTQKTFISDETSSFSRVNVRSLFNHVEKTVKKAMRYYLFEQNTNNVRSAMSSDINKYLLEIKGDNGLEDYRVFIDDRQQTDEVIVVNVYIKPKYVAEFIHLRMNNVGTNEITSAIE